MPTIAAKGLSIQSNKIWSENTGRNASGNMQGTIIAIKRKFEIKFVPLTQAQVNLIESVISQTTTPYPTVVLTLNSGKTYTFSMYSGDITYDMYADNSNLALYTDVTLSLIER